MFQKSLDYIVVGLGNAGDEYNLTRHNMGFIVLDKIASNFDFKFSKTKFNSIISKNNILNKNILFLKPLTYMNRSGEAVSLAANFYKIPTEKIIIIYDDITLDLGQIKIKTNGSAGGHNGIKNIISLLNQDNFIRIKVGVSKKPSQEYNLADWVLSKFKETELENLNKGVNLACECFESIIKNGFNISMNKYNQKNK
ncbi:MAG: aminoacyl-tRNA hydrolase [Oscillospiraceae bacterium]|nr:aminoacyl-tRNA hydrolase [Oscillospiraceae bacterium]